MAKSSSGTQAGYNFARSHGLTTQAQVDAYEGPSDSFRDGLQQWVNEVLVKTQAPQATNDPNQTGQSSDNQPTT